MDIDPDYILWMHDEKWAEVSQEILDEAEEAGQWLAMDNPFHWEDWLDG